MASNIRSLTNPDECERLIIAAVMLTPNKYMETARQLVPDEFQNWLCALVFGAILDLDREGLPYTSPRNVIERMEAKGINLEPFGGATAVSALRVPGPPADFDIYSHVKAVRDRSTEEVKKRMALEAAKLIEQGDNPAAVIFKTSNEIAELNVIAKDAEITDEKFQNLFLAQPANQWLEEAGTTPAARMLFGEFWHEGELCILFADTNLGKSILAVQIGDSISRGQEQGYFKLEVEPQRVLLLDFELSSKQFEARYSKKSDTVVINYVLSEPSEKDGGSVKYNTNHYKFSDKFIRAEISPDNEQPDRFKTFEDYLNYSLEQLVVEKDVKVVIVDNITYLRSETEQARDALPLMKHLKKLKSKHGLSILALAHTPKRDLSKPITRNDLQGSKMLINFCDSAFAIGESHKDTGFRYLKQIKARNTEFRYDADNVCVCQLNKPDNFLKFEFLTFGAEREHLKERSDDERTDLINQAKALAAQGKTQREIAFELKVSASAVNKYLRQ